MPTSGDVVELDLGQHQGREAGLLRPAVIVTAPQRIVATRGNAGAQHLTRIRETIAVVIDLP